MRYRWKLRNQLAYGGIQNANCADYPRRPLARKARQYGDFLKACTDALDVVEIALIRRDRSPVLSCRWHKAPLLAPYGLRLKTAHSVRKLRDG